MNDHSRQILDFDQLSEQGLRYAYSIVRDPDDAADSVQEALCRLLTKRTEGTCNEQHAGLFYTIVRNLCIDVLRKRRRHQSLQIEPTLDSAEPPTAELDALRGRIDSSVQALPDTWASALRLRVDSKLSYDEIAQVMQCTKGQVRTWIYRARKQLAKEFDDLLSGATRS